MLATLVFDCAVLEVVEDCEVVNVPIVVVVNRVVLTADVDFAAIVDVCVVVAPT